MNMHSNVGAVKKNEYSFKAQFSKSIPSYILIAPFMIAFIVFIVIPVLSAILLSFTDFNMLQFPNWVGFDNYRRLFLSDSVFLIAAKNTLLLALITGPLSYILCFFFAWLVNELPTKLCAIMTVILYAPSISGQTYTIWAWILSGDRYGLLNGLLMKAGFIDEPIQWLTNTSYMLGATIVVQLWLSLGTSFLAHIAGLKNVDTTLYEAAAIDGVKNRLQEVIYITLPSMKPQLLFAAVQQIISAFSVGAVQMTLTGNPSTEYATHTIIAHISDHSGARFEMGYSCAMSTLLLVVMLGVNRIINKVLKSD